MEISLIEIVALAVYFMCLGLAMGWLTRSSKKTPINTEEINQYLKDKFPDVWVAYKQGVHEGYEQGVRDGQEMPDEPA